MRASQPTPRLWLLTDERADEELEAAIGRLPRGAGVIFRHHATPPADRRRRYAAVQRIARARGLVLVLAGSPRQAIGWKADGAHGRSLHVQASRALIRTAPAHDAVELRRARRAGAVALVSPVFPTRSHAGGRTLGVVRFGLLAARRPPEHGRALVIALGGMSAKRYRRIRPLGAGGWAAIDAWRAPDQKRKAVPT